MSACLSNCSRISVLNYGNFKSNEVLTPRIAPVSKSSSLTTLIAEFDISPGGGTIKRHAQAITTPKLKLAIANDAWSFVN